MGKVQSGKNPVVNPKIVKQRRDMKGNQDFKNGRKKDISRRQLVRHYSRRQLQKTREENEELQLFKKYSDEVKQWVMKKRKSFSTTGTAGTSKENDSNKRVSERKLCEEISHENVSDTKQTLAKKRRREDKKIQIAPFKDETSQDTDSDNEKSFGELLSQYNQTCVKNEDITSYEPGKNDFNKDEKPTRNDIKYWKKRNQLFTKFNEGIKLDRESFYSVTPELVAEKQADKCKCRVIVDAFCGAGGNTIQFALICKKVIAIDIDPIKIEMARHNAAIYNVEKKIKFIVGDFLEKANDLKADVVFMSPPWGGPSYCSNIFDLNKKLKPAPISELLSVAYQISKDVAVFLPKNSNRKPLLDAGCGDIEENISNNKVIGITAYFGNLAKKS